MKWIRNFSQKTAFVPSRTYREELYSARRITIDPRGSLVNGLKAETLPRGLGMFKDVMERDQIRQETRARQCFQKPCRLNLLNLFKKQEGKFNAMVSRNIELVKEIQLAKKK